MNKVRKRPKQRNNKRVKRRSQNREPGRINLVIERGIGQFMPQEYRVRLVWPDATLNRNNVGATAANWKYRTSGFDPDPGAASGAIPGFTPLAAFYEAYRIRRMALSITSANLETFPLMIVMWPSMENNTVNALTATQLRDYSVMPKSRSQLVGPLTGHNVTPKMRVVDTTEQVMGENYIEADINIQAAVTGNPNLPWYINIGIISTVVLVNGIYIDARLELDVEFYRRRQLLS